MEESYRYSIWFESLIYAEGFDADKVNDKSDWPVSIM